MWQSVCHKIKILNFYKWKKGLHNPRNHPGRERPPTCTVPYSCRKFLYQVTYQIFYGCLLRGLFSLGGKEGSGPPMAYNTTKMSGAWFGHWPRTKTPPPQRWRMSLNSCLSLRLMGGHGEVLKRPDLSHVCLDTILLLLFLSTFRILVQPGRHKW